jgi:acetyl esterase/lipase
MKIKLLFMFTAIAAFSFAQHSTCDGSRYINNQYIPDTTIGIVYGNSTTAGGSNNDLLLDFFEPTGDVAVNRPLLIFAFGGSFIGGSRDAMHGLCAYYSAKGYACAAIDYRLYDGPLFPLPDSVVMTDEVIKAVFDMKAAIRFFREDADQANLYKIDTNLIFVGGISAGGIVANHAGMLQETDVVQPYIQTIIDDNGGWTGNSSTNTQYGDGVAGSIH